MTQDGEMSQAMLEEMRKLNQFAERSHKEQKVFAVIMIVILVIFILFAIWDLTSLIDDIAPSDLTWSAIQAERSKGNLDKAIEMAKELVDKNPKDHYAHSLLGHLYNASGDNQRAEEEFLKAYELFPSEDNEKYLITIKKILGKHL